MGKYVNSALLNSIAWATVVIVAILTGISTLQLIFPSLGS
jgi:Mn2+/Fe2+ NRAMP family transporter